MGLLDGGPWGSVHVRGGTSNPMQTQMGVPELTRDKSLCMTRSSHWGHLRGPSDQMTYKVSGIGAILGLKDAEMGICGGVALMGGASQKGRNGSLQKA